MWWKHIATSTLLAINVCPEGFSKSPLLPPHHSELLWLPKRTILNLKTQIIMSKNICWVFFFAQYHEHKGSNQYWWVIKRLFHIINLCVLATLYTLSLNLTLIPSRWGNSSRSQNPWHKISFVIILMFWELYQRAIFWWHTHHNSFWILALGDNNMVTYIWFSRLKSFWFPKHVVCLSDKSLQDLSKSKEDKNWH